MLHGLCLIAHPVACSCMSLGVAAQGLSPVKLFNFLFSVIAEAWCNNVGSVCTALSALSGSGARAFHVTSFKLQIFIGCILPKMHCRCQNCWGLLHLFTRVALCD